MGRTGVRKQGDGKAEVRAASPCAKTKKEEGDRPSFTSSVTADLLSLS